MVRIFQHYIHRQKLHQFTFDVALVVVVLLLALFFESATPLLASPKVLLGAVLMATGISAINSTLGIYLGDSSQNTRQLRWRALGALCLSLPLAYLVFRMPPLGQAERQFYGLALLTTLVLLLLYRSSAAARLARKTGQVRVLVYGDGPQALKVGLLLLATDPHVKLLGCYVNPEQHPQHGDASASIPNLFSKDISLPDLVQKERVQEIVVAPGGRRSGNLLMRELLDCRLQGVKVLQAATHFEQALGQVRRDTVSAGWMVFAEGFAQNRLRLVTQRVFDIFCASALLLLSLPVMALTALLIVLETGRPMLYLQERVGLNGRCFRIFKFRSMYADAEKDGQPRWASKADARVTRVGRFIRRHRIDELPQLLNVLAGDMSLVGPRPERPGFVNTLSQNLPYYGVRHSVKPGITGWAQVRYRGGFDVVKNDAQLAGTVANNAATNVLSGNNTIAEGSFANSSGLPMVIQNSGSNVLIQNSTIVNLQLQ